MCCKFKWFNIQKMIERSNIILTILCYHFTQVAILLSFSLFSQLSSFFFHLFSVVYLEMAFFRSIPFSELILSLSLKQNITFPDKRFSFSDSKFLTQISLVGVNDWISFRYSIHNSIWYSIEGEMHMPSFLSSSFQSPWPLITKSNKILKESARKILLIFSSLHFLTYFLKSNPRFFGMLL